MDVMAGKVKLKGFGLVRDKDGKPKIDDYKNCSEVIKSMLTQEEKEVYENGFNSRNSD